MATTLPYIMDDQASPELKASFDEIRKVMGNVPQLLRILANLPPMVGGFMDMAGPIFGGEHLPMDLKILAILRTAELNNCDYCRAYYKQAAVDSGFDGDRRKAVNAPEPPPTDLFNEKEIAVMKLADEMTRAVRAKPETVEEAKQKLGMEGTLEAMSTIALFNYVNRMARTSGLTGQEPS